MGTLYTPRQPAWLASVVVTLGTLFFTAVGGYILFGFLSEAGIQRAASTFPTAPGRLIDAHIKGGRGRSLVVQYDYTVDGVPHSGNHHRYVPRNDGGAYVVEAARKLEAKVGASVLVYYDPTDPTVSLLDPSAIEPGDLKVRYGIGFAFFLIPLALFLMTTGQLVMSFRKDHR